MSDAPARLRHASRLSSALVPSGKLGGDPLRAWLVARSGVSGGRAIGGVTVDRTLEIGSSAPFSVLFAVVLLQHGVPQLEQALVTVVMGARLSGLYGLDVSVWLIGEKQERLDTRELKIHDEKARLLPIQKKTVFGGRFIRPV